MTRRRVALIVAGIAVGSGVALATLLAFGGEEETPATASTTTTTTVPAAWWVDEDEIPLGPAVLVIDGLVVEDDEAVLHFTIHDINPVGPGRLSESNWLTDVPLQRLAEEAAVAPEAWTLITAAGEIPGTTGSPRARTARFPLPRGILPEVIGLRLNRYWMRVPYAYEIALPSNAIVGLDEGYSLVVGGIIEQPNSKIVQLDIVTPGGFATSSDPGALLVGVLGEGWSFTSGRTTSGLQLVHDATPLPDPIRFVARSAYWVPFDRPVEIDAGALRLG
ncbi:MAG: hypothetical protein ABIJ48_07385 [Actinomycetota bacterium]